MKKIRRIACTFVLLFLVPACTLAGQEASVLLRPGSPSAPLDAYFDLADALGTGINQSVKVTISAHNTQKTAVKFKDVYLIDKSGTMVGVNAAKSDALQKDIPTTFIFQNFGVSPTKLANVVGVRMSFLSMGGDDPTDIVKVSGVQASVIRDIGESCVSIDPNILEAKEKPILTVDQVVNQDRRTAPIAGDGGGGGGGSTNTGYRNPTAASGTFLSGGAVWGSPSSIYLDDNLQATASLSAGLSTYGLYAGTFGFTVPAGATVNGVEVNVDRSGSANASDSTVQLTTDGGTVTGNNKAAGAWASSEIKAYGGSGDMWGLTSLQLTQAVVNSSAFGVVVSATATAGAGVAIGVDNIQIRITYTTGGSSVYDAFTDLIYSLSKRVYCLVTLSCKGN